VMRRERCNMLCKTKSLENETLPLSGEPMGVVVKKPVSS
jgi:hypothetical protein